MTNKLWTFGDSFTEGVFHNIIYKLFKIYGYSPVIWPEIVSSELNLKLRNISNGGISNNEILSNILEFLPQIKKGDIVIISDTIPVRTFGYDYINNKMSSFNNEIFNIENNNLNEFPNSLKFEDKKILIDYISNFIIKYENKWIKYWEIEFKKIIDICLSNEIECYYWSHKYWKDFTSITEETNNSILDDHWGGNGNKKFSEYLIRRIHKKDYFNEIKPTNLI